MRGGQDRYFVAFKRQRGKAATRLATAWCLAGATLFMMDSPKLKNALAGLHGRRYRVTPLDIIAVMEPSPVTIVPREVA
jgi:hypothetical protein